MDTPHLLFSDIARQALHEEGLTEAAVAEYLDKSVPCRIGIPGINRRYKQWAFQVDGDTVQRIVLHAPPVVGSGKHVMHEECEHCLGSGCKKCGWRGEVLRLF